MRFPADRMTAFLGALSYSFTSSPQNRKVLFPSARTWSEEVGGRLSLQATDSSTWCGSVSLQRVPGCSHIHKGVRVPSWSGGSRAWPCGHPGRWCSTRWTGRPGTAGGSWGRWSCRKGPSFPHPGRGGGGRTGQIGNTNWGNTEDVMAAVFKGWFRIKKKKKVVRLTRSCWSNGLPVIFCFRETLTAAGLRVLEPSWAAGWHLGKQSEAGAWSVCHDSPPPPVTEIYQTVKCQDNLFSLLNCLIHFHLAASLQILHLGKSSFP